MSRSRSRRAGLEKRVPVRLPCWRESPHPTLHTAARSVTGAIQHSEMTVPWSTTASTIRRMQQPESYCTPQAVQTGSLPREPDSLLGHEGAGAARSRPARKDRHGRLEVIRQAEPAPTVAVSLEVRELRAASKAQVQRAFRDAKRHEKALTDPELRVSTQLAREAEVVFEKVPTPSVRVWPAAVRASAPREELDSADPLVQHLHVLCEPGGRPGGSCGSPAVDSRASKAS